MYWWSLLNAVGRFEYEAWHLWHPYPQFMGYICQYNHGEPLRWRKAPKFPI